MEHKSAASSGFRRSHPFVFAILVLVAAWAGLTVLNTAVIAAFGLAGQAGAVFASATEIVVAIVLAVVLKRTTDFSFGFTKKGLGEALLYLLPVLAIAAFAFESDASQWVDAGTVPRFDLVMVGLVEAVGAGLYEETAYRGILVNGIVGAVGRRRGWTGIAVFGSGLLFGAMHLMNCLFGYQDLSSTLVQMVYTVSLGLVWAAVYVRTRNLWAVAASHMLIDFSSFLSPQSIAGGSSGAVDLSMMPDLSWLIVQLAVMLGVCLAYALVIIRPKMHGTIESYWPTAAK